MAHQINPHQQKLAEKLTILNDRGIGMLTRIFNIKKVLFSYARVCVEFDSTIVCLVLISGMCRNKIETIVSSR
jgi:hypothetical protein